MQAEEARRLAPFHQTLHQLRQVWGGERELMLFLTLTAGGLIVSAMNQSATILGTCIQPVCVYGLREMAKTGPNMSKVYVRQLKHGNYYGSFSRPHRAAKSPCIY